ncbi:MAG: DUF2330 domain-containing protein [Prochloron sp. SP5CPC1]|nr:DUF2330 domain-containing protein [Candidatus Paraprochloron terpiosi SP5CPC1]
MMRFLRVLLLIMVACLLLPGKAIAFCGFYVATADAQLYNQASQVAIARDGNRTILTMANDYQGAPKDFALVVPVPVILQEEQVNVADSKIIARLDGFSAPRLVEYFDPNPCEPPVYFRSAPFLNSGVPEAAGIIANDASLGVTVEAEFTVGEYDIVILSAEESDGLETWLSQNDYKIPKGVSRLLKPYIRQEMKFFVAKVNLAEFANTGFKALRPLQIAYESPKFMLPIRLGTVNSQGEQDLILYLLSPKGQIELTNYRTVQVPSNVEIPEFVQEEFDDFYRTMFTTAYRRENKEAAFLEYAWDMSWCDPCADNPLTEEELKQAGVFWLIENTSRTNVFLTRLHLRYTGAKFAEDLRFQTTSNSQLFQGRYIIRHPFTGETNCREAEAYERTVRQRQEQEAQTLANLTGWDINEIRNKVNF